MIWISDTTPCFSSMKLRRRRSSHLIYLVLAPSLSWWESDKMSWHPAVSVKICRSRMAFHSSRPMKFILCIKPPIFLYPKTLPKVVLTVLERGSPHFLLSVLAEGHLGMDWGLSARQLFLVIRSSLELFRAATMYSVGGGRPNLRCDRSLNRAVFRQDTPT